MKKIYSTLLLTAALSMGLQAQTLWENFEDVRKCEYFFENGVFIPYQLNPDQSGVNTSIVAAQYIRDPGAPFDVIVIDNPMLNVTDYITGAKQMSIDVWSPAAGTTVQITLENSTLALPENFPTGRHSVYLTSTQTSNAWETLTFSYFEQPDASVPSNSVDRLALLFNPGATTNETYYWDNLNGPELVSDPCADVETNESILNDFECQQNVNYIAASNAPALRRVVNPDMSTNPSEYVGTYVRSGATDDNFIARTDGALMLNDNSSQVTMDIWDPNAPSTVIFSLQTSTNELIQEMVAETSVSSTWETLTFDIAPDVIGSTDIEQFVVLIDPGSTTTDTYYFDNISIPGLTSAEDTEFVSGLTAYPNPSTDFVTIEYNLEKQGDVNITLTDITGRIVENKIFDNQPNGNFRVEFNTNNYAAGIYLYNVSVSGQNHTGKIVVNN
ncbi:T9SS type A sorting domain-containing protein [Cryomorphaceae bacterium 1068]|nr:T9SS type A sorting domain-containing protein [Cryomorphaceae bacterium 1068]